MISSMAAGVLHIVATRSGISVILVIVRARLSGPSICRRGGHASDGPACSRRSACAHRAVAPRGTSVRGRRRSCASPRKGARSSAPRWAAARLGPRPSVVCRLHRGGRRVSRGAGALCRARGAGRERRPTDVSFEGFPRRAGERRAGCPRATICARWRSPSHPVARRHAPGTPGDCEGGGAVRELTKLDEEVCCGTAAEVLASIEGDPLRGEVVVAVEGDDEGAPVDMQAAVASARALVAEGGEARRGRCRRC